MPISSFPTLVISHPSSSPTLTSSFSSSHPMANDAVFRASLVWLATVIVVVGVCTQSFKKMMLTYVVGVLGISALLLPDWGYFDRDFSRWTSPVSAEERASEVAQRSGLIRSLWVCSIQVVDVHIKLISSQRRSMVLGYFLVYWYVNYE
ncbi:signal peptidase complex-like protein DTM1 isoform X1 [Prunus avium]|uniref:Signal peptidase complex-like protein DTM1 isoform X1 n=1 Tax=Prunus avium TaxID=42229 RepID=A0A6P5SK36_PRUAV|nr:signal peptidase complex-like protein DTM1 isoform X1 [Prunus avium]